MDCDVCLWEGPGFPVFLPTLRLLCPWTHQDKCVPSILWGHGRIPYPVYPTRNSSVQCSEMGKSNSRVLTCQGPASLSCNRRWKDKERQKETGNESSWSGPSFWDCWLVRQWFWRHLNVESPGPNSLQQSLVFMWMWPNVLVTAKQILWDKQSTSFQQLKVQEFWDNTCACTWGLPSSL